MRPNTHRLGQIIDRAALQALVVSGHVQLTVSARKWRYTTPEKLYQAVPGARLEPDGER